MPTIHGRKAVNFDLNDNLLKKYYPSKSYKNAWRDIKMYLINNQFEHRQYSGYVSINEIDVVEVGNIIGKMSRKWTWLSKSEMQFDVTNVSEEYSLIPKIKQESGLIKDELM
ncbi:hypothetical protein AALI59_03485 [Thomasclavelia cocleata]|uniref:hypothetical protein n=1 Tax=Thomasclavelia cocleata TaxID=69824 RepID=UPI003518D6E5